METLLSWPFAPLVALAVPSTLAFVALLSPRRAEPASLVAVGLALLFTLAASGPRAGSTHPHSDIGVRVDWVTCIMLLLVTGLGTIVIRFSQTYLRGEGGLLRYLRWLLLTLSAVTALIVTSNLLVMAIFWTATSVALHQLLTFFADRPAALLAAHKKFLVSRFADGFLLTSLLLVYSTVDSFEIGDIAAWVSNHPDLPLAMETAAVCLVVAVALRSAQLPFHGWLMQVMEAPTPVSAFLHAGVVNVGGFILIRLAPWIAQAQAAQLLLVTIGLLTTTVAALVMTTRVSVKVALAWSTCAQMGFMLAQCGLGLWPIAMLHLVAHSLYKAYAFLSAGSVVDEWRIQSMAAKPAPVSFVRFTTAVAISVGYALLGATIVLFFNGSSFSHEPYDLVLALILGLALVPVLTRGGALDARQVLVVAGRMVGVALLYGAWHAVAVHLVPTPAQKLNAIGWILAALCFTGLFAVKSALQLRPAGRWAQALHSWLFAGLYLDELFTRLTFRIWPPRIPRTVDLIPVSVPSPQTLDVRA